MDKSIIKLLQDFRRLWGGFRPARVILTANNLGVFDQLKTAKTAENVAEILGTDKRATGTLMNALASLGLLKKTGNKYKNMAVANHFLVKGSPVYQGDMLRHADSLWKSWSGLDEVVRTGLPNRAGSRNHEAFIRAMHNNAVFKARQVIGSIDLRGVKKALDLGGGPGTYSMELAKKNISVTLFDLPDTIDVVKKVIQEAKGENIDFIEGDFHADDIGRGYDLIFISQVFHSHSIDDNIALLTKAREALNPKGKIAVQEFYIDKNMAFPPQSALFSVNMLVNTASGRCYTPHEMKKWLSETGFKKVKEKKLEETVLLTGEKE